MPVSADLGPLAAVLERAGRPEAAERFSASQFGRALVRAAEKLPRPTPIPILVASVFEDPSAMRAPNDPTGGINRPPPRAQPALVTPSPTPVSPDDVTGRDRRRPPAAAATATATDDRYRRAAEGDQQPRQAGVDRAADRGVQRRRGTARRRLAAGVGDPPVRRPRRARRAHAAAASPGRPSSGPGTGAVPARRRRTLTATPDTKEEPSGAQEGGQGPPQGGEGGEGDHDGHGRRSDDRRLGPAGRRGRRSRGDVATAATSAEATAVVAVVDRALPPRRPRRARLRGLVAVPHSDPRGPRRRRPASRRGAGARRRLRLGDHDRRRSLRRVPHAG